uniref:ATP synthase complex subunit 8 n=1 Tax=Arhopalus unicolor TaxID=1191617 RepID=A0A7S6XWY7_9CUCU|nr:ATP synthase F0 subunit 8 [Arhopalus unicolor]YP_010363580.1 ATP synthase F0 subunit 8 [Cephalallus oberthueri]QOW83728.1 ATP synthase F0 subunit 8 [Arhopalus unicolor]UNZ12694.1 ATP synthase F0 subunit 8 [Cephalallus oberthueri]
MPQMAPLNWLSLFFLFLLIFLMFNFLNYFIFKYNIKKTLSNKKLLSYNWKW